MAQSVCLTVGRWPKALGGAHLGFFLQVGSPEGLGDAQRHETENQGGTFGAQAGELFIIILERVLFRGGLGSSGSWGEPRASAFAKPFQREINKETIREPEGGTFGSLAVSRFWLSKATSQVVVQILRRRHSG